MAITMQPRCFDRSFKSPKVLRRHTFHSTDTPHFIPNAGVGKRRADVVERRHDDSRYIVVEGTLFKVRQAVATQSNRPDLL